jgi:hypothetical protein
MPGPCKPAIIGHRPPTGAEVGMGNQTMADGKTVQGK